MIYLLMGYTIYTDSFILRIAKSNYLGKQHALQIAFFDGHNMYFVMWLGTSFEYKFRFGIGIWNYSGTYSGKNASLGR